MSHITEGIDPTAKEVCEMQLEEILLKDKSCVLIDIKKKIFAGVHKDKSKSTILSEPIEYYENIVFELIKTKILSLSIKECTKLMKHSKSKKVNEFLLISILSKCFKFQNKKSKSYVKY